MAKQVTALAQWFGSARMITQHVADACSGCDVAYIPFAGGMCEVPVIPARTLVVNDLHRHLVNLARVVANKQMCRHLQVRLRDMLFHPDELQNAQQRCLIRERTKQDDVETPSIIWAADYFCCCWMTRAGSAGTPAEFTGKLSLRWEAGGGDSNTRFRSAIAALEHFHRAMVERCTFSTLDCFEFFEKCKERAGHVIYSDPPFFGPGVKYRCAPPRSEMEHFHRTLAKVHRSFEQTRVVIRAYDVPLMRELYPQAEWSWRRLAGRKQTNEAAPEVLIVR